MYYLVSTARRKNAKRHIDTKSEDIQHLRDLAKNFNHKYRVEIYNGKWELVEALRD